MEDAHAMMAHPIRSPALGGLGTPSGRTGMAPPALSYSDYSPATGGITGVVPMPSPSLLSLNTSLPIQDPFARSPASAQPAGGLPSLPTMLASAMADPWASAGEAAARARRRSLSTGSGAGGDAAPASGRESVASEASGMAALMEVATAEFSGDADKNDSGSGGGGGGDDAAGARKRVRTEPGEA